MFWAVLLLVFAGLISKLMLVAGLLWFLVGAPASCARCDTDTVRVMPPRGWRAVYALLRVQLRWCPRCGERQYARATPGPTVFVGRAAPRPRPRGGPVGRPVAPVAPRVPARRG